MEGIKQVERIVFDAEERGFSVAVHGSNGDIYVTAGTKIEERPRMAMGMIASI
jgi:hypothetical protein